MHYTKIRECTQLIFCLAAAAFAAGPAAAQEAPASPTRVVTGVWVNDLRRIDFAEGTFEVDFFLWQRWRGAAEPPAPEIANASILGQAINFYELERRHWPEDEQEILYRVSARLKAPLSLAKYPFDAQRLPIIIEDGGRTGRPAIYVADKTRSGIAAGVGVTGFKLGKLAARARVLHAAIKPAVLPGATATPVHRLIFSVTAERRAWAHAQTFLLPIWLILAIAGLVLFIGHRNFSLQVAIGIVSLLSLTMLHGQLARQIAVAGYRTVADRFFLAAYLAAGLAILETVICDRLVAGGRPVLANRVEKLAQWILPLGTILAMAAIYWRH